MKRKAFVRAAASVLVLLMVIAPLSGCKKNTEDPNSSGGSEYVYVPNYISLSEEITEMNNSCISGDTIYFTRSVAVYPDGTTVPQVDIDAYYEQINTYYETMYGTGGRVAVGYATASPMPATGTDVADEEDTEEAESTEGEDATETTMPIDDDIGMLPPPEAGFSYETRLYSVNADGTGLRSLDAFSPMNKGDRPNVYGGINKITVDGQGNLWLLESLNEQIFDFPEGFDPNSEDRYQYYVRDENNYYLRRLDENGADVVNMHLNEFIDATKSEYFYLYNFGVDKDGNVFFDDNNNTVYVVGADGALITNISLDGWVNGYVNLGDGSVAVAMNSETGGTSIKKFDLAARTWGETYECDEYIYNFLPGGDSYDFCYNNGMSLYGYDLETGTETKIITWINNDIDGNNLQFCDVKENGDIFLIAYSFGNMETTANFEVINLVKTPAAEVTQKTPITLATLYLQWDLRQAILDFNRTNPDYRIEVLDYSEYNTAETYDAGSLKLNTEIISGRIPDLIAIGELPYKQYAAKGLLEDLYPFIDGDSGISRDELVEEIFMAMEDSGKLYYVASSFNVMSMVGKASVLGSEPGWTMRDLQNIIADHPEADVPLGMYVTKDTLLYYLFSMNIDSYVNWITGECRFDTPDFKSMLEFANTFPTNEDIDYENMQWVDEAQLFAEGRMIAQFYNMYDFYSYQYTSTAMGGDLVFKGMPGEDGGGAVASVTGGLAMTTSCKNKEAAWTFMSTMLSQKYQENNWNGLPTNKAVFNMRAEEAMRQDYDLEGNPISKGSVWIEGGDPIEYYALTQAELDQIIGLIASVRHVASYDQSLLNIINEEASAYFAGEKSVDEVAYLIQSKMTLYINEQR